MFVVILMIHILVCFALMAVVLMQSGKGRGLAGAFGGGGGNQTLFGGRGAVDFLGKATWVLGAAFMLTSLTLAILSGGTAKKAVSDSLIKKQAATAPAMPGGAPSGSPEQAPAGSPASAPGGAAPVQPAGATAQPAQGARPATPPPGGGK
jgi:preprotein translocase subunit SecG